MAVESFVFYRSFLESIAEMRPKDQLATFWAIATYALEGEEPELPSTVVRAVFPVMRANLDANKQRRTNGKRGGRTKEPVVSPEKTNGFEVENQWFADSKPNETENETETVTETEKDTVIENENETETGTNTNEGADAPTRKRQGRFIPPSVEEVEAYCREKGYQLDARHFIDYYEAGGWMRGKTKIKDWKACIRTWRRKESDRPPEPKQELLTFDNWEE